jgi:hypothetical protein
VCYEILEINSTTRNSRSISQKTHMKKLTLTYNKLSSALYVTGKYKKLQIYRGFIKLFFATNRCYGVAEWPRQALHHSCPQN